MRIKTSQYRSNEIELVVGLLPARSALNMSVAHAGIAKSLSYISRNYCRPILVRDLEGVAGLSRRGFIKAFQKHVGSQPAQFLRHLRMEHAKQLLIELDLPLREVATQSGYRSVNSFWVAFRQTTGLGAGHFRRQARLKTGLRHYANGATPTDVICRSVPPYASVSDHCAHL